MATATKIKRGDTGPKFRATLNDADGDPIDLTGAAALFMMRDVNSRAIKVAAGAMTILDAALGRVEYAWVTADTDTAGIYEAEVQVTFSDGLIETFPNDGHHRVEVVEDVS